MGCIEACLLGKQAELNKPIAEEIVRYLEGKRTQDPNSQTLIPNDELEVNKIQSLDRMSQMPKSDESERNLKCGVSELAMSKALKDMHIEESTVSLKRPQIEGLEGNDSQNGKAFNAIS